MSGFRGARYISDQPPPYHSTIHVQPTAPTLPRSYTAQPVTRSAVGGVSKGFGVAASVNMIVKIVLLLITIGVIVGVVIVIVYFFVISKINIICEILLQIFHYFFILKKYYIRAEFVEFNTK
jgi:hypothetical protein